MVLIGFENDWGLDGWARARYLKEVLEGHPSPSGLLLPFCSIGGPDFNNAISDCNQTKGRIDNNRPLIVAGLFRLA